MMSRREREDVLVRRAVTVETIPSGQAYELQEGELAQITQALGGSFTLVVRGQEGGADALPQPSSVGTGREWLARQLAAAGGSVDFTVAYTRHAPQFTHPQHQTALAAAGDGSVWLFSSSQAVQHLQQWLPGQSWQAARAVATHPRIAQAAEQAGFGVVRASRPTLDAVVASIESLP